LVLNNAKFEITAVKPAQYPASNVPEVAFVGRSNVGKSSIINSLLNRENLARVGSAPGKTREINFYNIDDSLYFVDLPGYGYASVSKGKKSTWFDIVETYLYSRLQLKLIIMLVDIRHAPSAEDKMMYDWLLTNNVPHLIVASKSDKISRGQINPRLQEIVKVLGVKEGIAIIPFSAETKNGRDILLEHIQRMTETV
jgi:GTP-binding protein